jgi:hypothetical protein
LVHPFNIGCFTNKHMTIPSRFLLPTIHHKKGALSISFSSCWSFFCSLCIPIFSILVHLRA